MHKNLNLLSIICIIFLFLSRMVCETPTANPAINLWPLPKKITTNQDSQKITIDPCSIYYRIITNPPDMIQQFINWYLKEVFKCQSLDGKQKGSQYTLFIVIRQPTVVYAYETYHEKYELIMRQDNHWELFADYYPGFLRGFETFSQLLQRQSKNGQYYLEGIPIFIEDQPSYKWRGLMIDSARHFMSMQLIKHTIDGMLFNKMNVMHWHIVEQDSFPIFIPKRPQLSNYGSIAGVYSTEEIKQIIQYAKIRGVRVVPQFDSPAHTTSWGRSQILSSIALNCNGIYKGQFDPTLNLTYQVVSDVLEHANDIFPDNFIHFGGDQVTQNCWDQRPEIKNFMLANNISNYVDLQIYYRKRQKDLYRQKISKNKRVIYWANEQIDLPMEDNDIIQWWGQEKTLSQLQGRKNQIILSTYDQTYLDVGFGDKDGTDYRTYITWREVYSLNPKDEKLRNLNVIGGEVCMWSQMVDESNHDQKVWIRASSLAERLWNVDIDSSTNLLNIVERLIIHKKRMKQRGFRPSPVTVGLCQKDPSICF